MADRKFEVRVYRQADKDVVRARAKELDFTVDASNVDKAAAAARAYLEDRKLAVRAINHAPGDIVRATIRGARAGAPATVVAKVVTARKRVG